MSGHLRLVCPLRVRLPGHYVDRERVAMPEPELLQRQLSELALRMRRKRVWRYAEGKPVVIGGRA